jgi:tight adherence protein B
LSALLSQTDFLPLAFGAAMLVAALMLAVMLTFALANDQKRIRRRLARIGMGAAAAQAAGVNTPSLRRDTTDSSFASFDRLLKHFIPHPAKFRERLLATGWRISIGEYVLACVLVGSLFFGVRMFYGTLPLWLAALLGVSSGLWLPHRFVTFMIKRRRNHFIMLLPEALDLIVRGLRSGLPITEAIKVVGQELPDPVGMEFRRIIESFSIGLTLEQALWAVAERVGVPEFRFFAISLTVQQETGGNLTETLDNLADVLRRRKQVKLKIRALTGEARASASILGALPFIMFGALMLIRPEYGMVLVDTNQGRIFLAVGFTLISTGIFIMMRMTKFEI